MVAVLKKNLATVKLIATLYAMLLIVFTIFRVIFFAVGFNKIGSFSSYELFIAFVNGLRFDIVIASYILIFPFVVLTVVSFFCEAPKPIRKFVFYYVSLLSVASFMVCAADIPWFSQFFSRFTVAAFQWADSPGFVLKMIFQEISYALYFLLFIALSVAFLFVLSRVFKNKSNFQKGRSKAILTLFSLLFLGLMFVGIRGRLDAKSPIRVGSAYFCSNAFLNQLGLNPNFTFIRSLLDKKSEGVLFFENSISDEDALANVRHVLGVNSNEKNHALSRFVEYDNPEQNHNIIIVLMESMSTAKMSRHGNTDNLTPFLDSISNKGLYFENCFSAGIHTFNGVFSTLFALPSLPGLHPMKDVSMPVYQNIASELKMKNYKSVYFTTHDGQFDNVEGFLYNNGIDRVVSAADYPAKNRKTTLGVPDDFMFEFSIDILQQMHENGNPFLAVYLTSSDHGPWYIPEYFTPQNADVRKGIVEYADFSIRKFIHLASKCEWFSNTIFVFVADHGAAMDFQYEIPVSYVHIPFLVYAPEIISNHTIVSNVVGQLDVFPTLMGLLNKNWENKTMGMDVLRQNREYMFFTADNKIGVADTSHFLIIRPDLSMSLFNFKKNDKKDLIHDLPQLAEKMKTFAFSHFIVLKKNIFKK